MSDILVAGSPRFSDPALAAAERRDGAATAWRQALARTDKTAAESAAQAMGHFSVGLRNGAGRTVLAVDRFATQTICYRADGAELAFSERADALASRPDDIDPQALFDYLYFHAIPAPRTVYRGVHRLPAGHVLWHDAKELGIERYWSPSFSDQPIAFDQARSAFRDLLRQAVTASLDGSRPAAFLSGGTDSSTIAGVLREVTGAAPATYSIGFEAEGYDEMEYARLASKHFGTEHHEHYISPADLVRLIPQMAVSLDQPFGNSSAVPAYFCALKAREDGVTRLLAGDGGDELFGGNTRYAKQSVFSTFDVVPAAFRKGFLEPMANSGALDNIPLFNKGASYIRQASVAMPGRLQTYNLLNRLGLKEVLEPGFLAQVDIGGPQQQECAVWAESAGAGFVNRMLAYDWRYTLAEIDLPKVRCSTGLAGVSVAYPLLDQALVDFSSQLPANFKLRGLKLRWFFKEALRGFLPDAILTKKKHGFGLPFGVWATRDTALKSLATDSVRALGERGIVRREFTEKLMRQHLPEHPGYYGEMVWLLMMLEQWFQHHAPDFRIRG